MPERRTRRKLASAGAVAAGLCVFALFIHAGLPLVLLSAAGLAVAGTVMGLSVRDESSRLAASGLSRPSRRAAVLVLLGCVVGLALGVAHRWQCGLRLLPDALRSVALLAALIGATEEVVYRGYIQGRVRSLGVLPALALAALAHTAYKCALFSLPPPGVESGLLFLATWTLLGGLLFGILREAAGNVLPPLAAHACFDIIVYGELARAPWWVWS